MYYHMNGFKLYRNTYHKNTGVLSIVFYLLFPEYGINYFGKGPENRDYQIKREKYEKPCRKGHMGKKIPTF